MAKKGSSKNFEKFISEGMIELDKKGYVKAAKFFQKAAQADEERYEPYLYLGNLYFEEGKEDEARKNYLTAIEMNPKVKDDFLSSAKLLYEKKVYARAILELKKIILLDKENWDAVSLLVKIYSEDEKFDKAKECLENIYEQNPDSVDVMRELMYLFEDLGDYEKALEFSEKLIMDITEDAFLLNNNGFILEKLGRYDEAIGYFDMAIQLDELTPMFHFNLGTAYRLMENFSRALECYDQALKIYPDDTNVLDAVSNTYIKMGDLEKAKETLKRILEINKNDAFVHKNYGEIYFLDGEIDKAIDSFKNAIAMNPKSLESYLRLGQIYYSQAKFSEAKKYLQTGVNLFPKNIDMVRLLAIMDFEAGSYSDSIKLYKRYIANAGFDGDIMANLGFIYNELGFIHFAIWAYEKANKYKESEEILFALAQLSLRVRKIDESIGYLKSLLTLAPEKVKYYIMLSQLLTEKGDLTHAAAVLEVAQKTNGDDYDILVNLGELGIKEKKMKEALGFLKTAISKNAKRADAYIAIAKIFLGLNQPAKAETMLTQALKFVGESAEIYFYLGDVAGKFPERFDEAVEFYEKAKLLDPKITATHFKLAQNFIELGHLEESFNEIKTHLEESPDDIEALKMLGYIHIQSGVFKEALDTYEKVLGYSPGEEKNIENVIQVLREELENRMNE